MCINTTLAGCAAQIMHYRLIFAFSMNHLILRVFLLFGYRRSIWKKMIDMHEPKEESSIRWRKSGNVAHWDIITEFGCGLPQRLTAKIKYRIRMWCNMA